MATIKTTKEVLIKINLKELKEIEKKISAGEKSGLLPKGLLSASPNGSDLCKLYEEYGDAFRFVIKMLKFSKKLQRPFVVLLAALDANCAAMPEQ